MGEYLGRPVQRGETPAALFCRARFAPSDHSKSDFRDTPARTQARPLHQRGRYMTVPSASPRIACSTPVRNNPVSTTPAIANRSRCSVNGSRIGAKPAQSRMTLPLSVRNGASLACDAQLRRAAERRDPVRRSPPARTAPPRRAAARARRARERACWHVADHDEAPARLLHDLFAQQRAAEPLDEPQRAHPRSRRRRRCRDRSSPPPGSVVSIPSEPRLRLGLDGRRHADDLAAPRRAPAVRAPRRRISPSSRCRAPPSSRFPPVPPPPRRPHASPRSSLIGTLLSLPHPPYRRARRRRAGTRR